MKASTEKNIAQCRAWLEENFPGYWEFSDSERRLLCCHYLVDVLQVREEGGNNCGPWPEAFLDTTGLGEGYSWCAAMQTFASIVAKAPYPLRSEGYNPAAVVSWKNWAKAKGYWVKPGSTPKRGYIAMKKTTATSGHIEVMVKPGESLGGNTSRGKSGSQSNGDGGYRRNRSDSYWTWGYACC